MRINEQIEHYSSINLLYISTLVIAIGLEGVVSLSIIYTVARMPILHSIGHSDKTRIKFFYKYGPKGLSCAYTRVQYIGLHSSFFRNSSCLRRKEKKQLDIYNRSTSTFLIIAYVKQEHGFYFHNRKLQRRGFLMQVGLALTVGLNSVDPKHYSGWSGELNACEADAEDMTSVVKSEGFKVTTLLTRDATRERVIEKI